MNIDNIKTQLDLYLTEISMELLGNRLYDLNGKRQNRLSNLFQAQPTNDESSPIFSSKYENSNDFLCSLGFSADYNRKNIKNLFESQLDYILSSANGSEKNYLEIFNGIMKYKNDQDLLVQDIAEFNLKRQNETLKITKDLNVKRGEAFEECLKKNTIIEEEVPNFVEEYYEDEKNDLMKECMDVIRLIKYIIQDPKNQSKKGDLVAYSHTVRTAKMEIPKKT